MRTSCAAYLSSCFTSTAAVTAGASANLKRYMNCEYDDFISLYRVLWEEILGGGGGSAAQNCSILQHGARARVLQRFTSHAKRTRCPSQSFSCWMAPESGLIPLETLQARISTAHFTEQCQCTRSKHMKAKCDMFTRQQNVPAVARMGLHSLGATDRCCVSGGKDGLYLEAREC
jgi:hypothetical protein